MRCPNEWNVIHPSPSSTEKHSGMFCAPVWRVVSILQPMFLATIFNCTLAIIFFCFSFWYWPKGGLTLNDSTIFQAFNKMFQLKVSTCTYAVCMSLSVISLFPILCSIAFWPPLHCAIYKGGKVARSHSVHWFTHSERKLLLVWAVSWAVSAKRYKNWANVCLIGKSRWSRLFYEIPI